MDVFDLSAKLKLDKSDYDSGLKSAESGLSKFGSKLKSGLGTVAKVTGAAVTVAAGAVASLAKSAVSAYGSYQQLTGGIETLFGKDAQTMLNKASKAYKTAGVSANQYMEMAIQSSAAMITSLEGDTAKAAEMMDMSIIDMSDNVNKMGTTMEAVQNAYRGFSRGNFTMLDNLALGYAGTKKGMQELLERANEINKAQGINTKYSIESYADMVEAIHVVQTEMGITGTTSKEAANTITGSAGSAKAAWEDLKTAMASGNDSQLNDSVYNLVASVTTMAENIIPILERALEGIGKFIQTIVPIISNRLPKLVEEILPGLLSAATSLVQGLIKALPGTIKVLLKEIPKIAKQIVSAIKEVLPQILQVGKDVLHDLTNGMDAGQMVDKALELFETFANYFIERLSLIMDIGMQILEKLVEGITEKLPQIVDVVVKIINRFVDTISRKLPDILIKGMELLGKLVEGILQNLPELVKGVWKAIKTFLETISDKLPDILAAGFQLLMELIEGIIEALPELVAMIPEIITTLVTNLLSPGNIGKLIDTGFKMIGKIFEGLFTGDFLGNAKDIIFNLLEAVLSIPAMIGEIGAKIVGFIFEGIKDAWGTVVDWVEKGIEEIFGAVDEARNAALAAFDEVNAQYEGKIKQNEYNYNKYGSAWGITGQESFASSNSAAAIAQQQGTKKSTATVRAEQNSYAGSASMAARAQGITINNYIAGTQAHSTTQKVKNENDSRGSGK